MLHAFLTRNRDEILRRTRTRVASRAAPRPTQEELTVAIPLFFDQLIATLAGVDLSDVIGRDATLHGERRQQMGFSIAQVVHDYGDLCQVVTQLAIEREAPIDTEEFKTLNRCLDDAIARAVTEHARVRERSISDEATQRLGFLAHELRNCLHTASISFDILKTGTVAINGSTGAVLARSLESLRTLVDRSLTQVRLDTDLSQRESIEISPFLEEIEAAGVIAAKDRMMSLSVDRGKRGIEVQGDRQLLGSAVTNLVQNALKFSRAKGHVRLYTISTRERVVIEVEDECNGLDAGEIDAIFEGSHGKSSDKSGLGLGLLITERAVEAMGGTVRARNGEVGCVFSIDLPRQRDHA